MPKQHQRRKSDIRESLIDRIIATKPRSKILADRKQIDLYLRQYFRTVPYEDLEGRSPTILGRAALSHLAFGSPKRKRESLIRIFNPNEKAHGYQSAYTIVEMVNDDMPFLVDSVAAAIARQNLNIHITIHPILRVHRDGRSRIKEILPAHSQEGRAESFIRFVIDKEVDEHSLKVLEHEIHKVLADVRAAVRDWMPMRLKMLEAKELLRYGPAGADTELRRESQALLQWMADDRFTFLGYREYRLHKRAEKLFLRPVKGTGLGLLASEERGGRSIELTKPMQRVTRAKDWLIITKANSRSTVHRHSYLDYVGVKKFDEDGNPVGEMRFIGLFTSAAYSENPRNIPLLRLKVRRVVERSGLEPAGHLGKALTHVLNTFPREELFQSSVSDLVRTTNGVLNLQERLRVRLFVRRDTFRRFYSCMVYVPREKYTTAVRRRIEKVLLREFNGTSVDTSVQISDSPLARMHVIVRIPVGERQRVDIEQVEAALAEAVVTWRDRLRSCLEKRFGVEQGNRLFRQFGDSFSPAYEGDIAPSTACLDVKRIAGLIAGEHNDYLLFHRPKDAATEQLNFRTFRRDEPFRLSNVLPLLEDMGVQVFGERPYEVRLQDGRNLWIQDFELRFDDAETLDIDDAGARFQTCFHRVFVGTAENDGFNRLILAAGLDWREVALIRCYGKYLLQLRIPFSQDYMEDVLAAHPRVAQALVKQFDAQFNPDLSKAARSRGARSAKSRIAKGLELAKTLDEDRILRAFAGAVDATLRTNYFQADSNGDFKPSIAIKLDPSKLPEAPLPRPKFEIFVYAPDVEGVHLRGGDIARGGLRWSDRREDFRTEILGLMKAQVVKNTVIVPTGAKGGFVPKNMPSTGSRDEIMQVGIACYRRFISALLDITDNVVDGKVVPPERVVRRDGDDPYLVVAADKGTATFLRHCQRTLGRLRLLAGRRICVWWLGGIRPQEDGHHRTRRVGSSATALP